MASSHYSSYASPDPSNANLPKVGQTRCYWALLSSELQFIYLDPILQSHLDQQAELLVGKSLLSFVHPDEQASAKIDLGGVLESRTLHGSVTRVRFSRLSKVRRQLGYDGPPAIWSEAEKIALDSNYMAVDIVINWAAEGLVLCFIHAIVDLTPSDNDELNKTGWSNWCGTPQMDPTQIHLLYHRLLSCIQRPITMNRVFQILDNRDGRPLLVSWPPDHDQGTQRPNARDFAVLVEDAQIGSNPQDGSDAKTSCTRRYKALQTTPSLAGSEIESIFIPHGSVIFACHKVNLSNRSSSSSSATMQQMAYPPPQNYPPSSSAYYDSGSPYALPPIPQYPTYPPQAAAAYAPQRWAQGPTEGGSSYTNTNTNVSPQQHQQQQGHWNSQSPPHPVASLPPAVSTFRSGSYPPPPQPGHHWQPPPSSSSPTFMESAASYPRSSSPGFNSSNPNNNYVPSPSTESTVVDDVVPPARRRDSPGSTRESIQYVPNTVGGSSGARASGNRPSGVLKCSSCKATNSPEWRKGPSGKKELCNACGLRYARSRAKKEGHPQSQRRRKDKSTVASGGIAKREASATPPSSASPSYTSMRRSFGDTSFSSTGSTSGSEIYHPHPHHSHVLDDKLTPSPSPPVPPGGPMSFVHYAPGGPGHPSPFYSVPSPLSHPPVQGQMDEQGGGSSLNGAHTGQGQGQTLPPLASYVGRVAGSPLATMPPASFERDREREREKGREKERELPAPMSLGMEPRHGHTRRGILTQQG